MIGRFLCWIGLHARSRRIYPNGSMLLFCARPQCGKVKRLLPPHAYRRAQIKRLRKAMLASYRGAPKENPRVE